MKRWGIGVSREEKDRLVLDADWRCPPGRGKREDTIPHGSHMMGCSSHKATARALMYGIPPADTPIRYLLYVAGCRWFKDWYFAEGVMEGEELPGNKPLSPAHKQRRTNEILAELVAYLQAEEDPDILELEKECRSRAVRILMTEGKA